MRLVAGLFLIIGVAWPQSTQAPLNRPYYEIISFFSARESLERGRASENAKDFLQARNTYLPLIDQLKRFNSTSYDVQALLASAEIGAARTTLALEPRLPPTRDNILQNRTEVIAHAHNAVVAAYTAFSAPSAGETAAGYKCVMFRVAGQAQYLEGLVEDKRETMLKGAELYTRVLGCDPANRQETEAAIKFIRSHANEKNHDEIMKTSGQFVELIGWQGKAAMLAVDAAYRYYKEHRESPFARERQ
jgi:hypothetical protein